MSAIDDLIGTLRDRIEDTDLEYYMDKDKKLRYALEYSISEVNNRRDYTPTEEQPYPAKYRMNVLDGAVWYLGKLGAEGYSSTSENGVSVSWKDLPDWLARVPPAFWAV